MSLRRQSYIVLAIPLTFVAGALAIVAAMRPPAVVLLSVIVLAAIGVAAAFALRARFDRDVTARLQTLIEKTRELAPDAGETEALARRDAIAALAAVIDNAVALVNERQAALERSQEQLATALDEALAASRAKSQFVATVSHEIRTPMNGAIGMLELLLDCELGQKEREYATTARDSAASLLTIIDDILDFSKIEAGKLELALVDVDLADLVEGVVEMLAAQARTKRISLMTFVDPGLPNVRADATRLRQILTNLVANAVKFTEQGRVAVWVRPDDDGRVRFSVEDTGIGLSPAAIERIFAPFAQADGSTTRRFGGTGLGLSIARRLVELMGSTIEVASQEGAGSTFAFALRFESIPGSLVTSRKLRGLRALVVDDDSASSRIVTRYLEAWGVGVETATDAESGLDRLRAAASGGRSFDVAIVDLVLPGIDGLAFRHRMNADRRLVLTKTVLVTAFDRHDLGQAAVDAGFDAFLTKPLHRNVLFDCVASVVSAGASGFVMGTATAAKKEAASRRRGETDGLRVLIAEDNVVNQQIAVEQLRKLGIEADVVGDGAAAVAAAGGFAYALVLMDCQMPVLDGYDATRAIRRGEAETGGERRVPIVAMTANALDDDRRRAREAGMDDYLAKPVRFTDLAEMVTRWTQSVQRVVIDAARLHELFDGDATMIARIVALCVENAERLILELEAAVTANDIARVLRLAHQLKGACANAGANELAELGATVESAAKDGIAPAALAARGLRPALARLRQQSAPLISPRPPVEAIS